MLLFLGYIFWFDHKEFIDNTHWKTLFEKAGLDNEIYNIKHDHDSWFYKEKSLCVGYNEENIECPNYETYCTGGETYGRPKDQVDAVLLAIKTENIHPKCPLIYEG